MSFEQSAEQLRWPEAGSKPEIGQGVIFETIPESKAKRPDEWVVMGLSEQDGVAMAEIWHGHAVDEFTKRVVPLEELRSFDTKSHS